MTVVGTLSAQSSVVMLRRKHRGQRYHVKGNLQQFAGMYNEMFSSPETRAQLFKSSLA